MRDLNMPTGRQCMENRPYRVIFSPSESSWVPLFLEQPFPQGLSGHENGERKCWQTGCIT